MTSPRPSDHVLVQARFDERLPVYLHLQALIVLLAMVFTAPLALLWLLVGRGFHRRQWEALSAELTPRSLKIRSGVLLRVQKNVPLDKITDVALVEGPILRRLGLCGLSIETAGSGVRTGNALLVGVVDAEGFRDRVLEQRDAVVFGEAQDGGRRALDDDGPARRAMPSPEPAPGGEQAVLVEIRDALLRVEELLERRTRR